MIYTIDYDPPDGHGYMPEFQNPFRGSEFDSADAAREALGNRIDGLEKWEPVAEYYDFAEGYYESGEEGCGSWVILGRKTRRQS